MFNDPQAAELRAEWFGAGWASGPILRKSARLSTQGVKNDPEPTEGLSALPVVEREVPGRSHRGRIMLTRGPGSGGRSKKRPRPYNQGAGGDGLLEPVRMTGYDVGGYTGALTN